MKSVCWTYKRWSVCLSGRLFVSICVYLFVAVYLCRYLCMYLCRYLCDYLYLYVSISLSSIHMCVVLYLWVSLNTCMFLFISVLVYFYVHGYVCVSGSNIATARMTSNVTWFPLGDDVTRLVRNRFGRSPSLIWSFLWRRWSPEWIVHYTGHVLQAV